MRTAAICPTCATYENALCILYNGEYLSAIDVAPLDSIEIALENINTTIANLPVGTSGTSGSSGTSGTSISTILSSGTYTPTLTLISAIESATPQLFHYIRVGNEVLVQGTITIDGLSSINPAVLKISLPIVSDFSSVENCSGFGSGDYTFQRSGFVTADTILNQASFLVESPFSAVLVFNFNFTYTVI